MYKVLAVLILLVISSIGRQSSSAVSSHVIQDRNWHAGTYRGLTVGKSTRADMVNVFGNPASSGPSADQDERQPIIWNDYGKITGDLSGRLAVEVDSRSDIIVGITISPEHMSSKEAITYFGNDYRLVNYEFCPGDDANEEAWPVFESPKSSEIRYIEYKSKGIAIHVDSHGNVNGIYFRSEPIGLASKNDCKKEVEKFVKESKPR